MRLLTRTHEKKYRESIIRDNTYYDERERHSLFYLLSGNDDLASKINHIYDFADHSIRLDYFKSENVDLSGSARNLVRLAFNMYNDYYNEYSSPLHLLSNLDEHNYNLAMFGMGMDTRLGYMKLLEEQEIDVEDDDEMGM